MKRPLLWLVLLASLSGCSSLQRGKPPAEVKELTSVLLDSIRSKIDEKKLAEAYQDVSYLERSTEHRIGAEELAALKSSILGQLVEVFRKQVEQKKFSDAFSHYSSFVGIGREDLAPDWSAAELLYRIARSAYEEGNVPLAFLFTQRALAAGEPSEERLRFTLQLAGELGNVTVYRQVESQLKSRGLEAVERTEPPATEIAPVGQMAQGTATIWVDKGIKLERGMGFPDRVIGSGFFIDRRGYLLTNYHVVASEVDPEYEGYSRLYIRLSKKVEEKIPAKVVGYDRIFDLALIKAEVKPPFILSYGGSSALKVGGRIMAIGSPAGLENTVTSGIVSATGRRFLQMGDAIQVDVPINYGNSGGPLLDDSGRLVGIVFAGIEQFEGVNFAIPYDWVEKALPRLYGGGEVKYPWLGMALHESDSGLEVIYTAPGSPAERAGIRQGDLILSFNGKSYESIGEVQSVLLDMAFPCLVSLEWQREGRSHSGVLSLAERPFSPIEDSLKTDRRDNLLLPLFGLKIEKTGQFLWRTEYVVKRVLPGSIADETGLSSDDPLSIQGWKIDTENRFALLQIHVKKRKSGFLESAVQMAAYLETDIFI